MSDKEKKPLLIEVAVGLPLYGTFTYGVPESMADTVSPGTRVLVPFGRRKVTGYVLGPGRELKNTRIKDIVEPLDEVPSIPATLLEDLKWMAEYYLAPVGEVFKGALPAGIEVASSAGLVITDSGKSALALDTTPQEERDMLAIIASEPGLSDKRLETLTGKSVTSRVTVMARKGWVLRQQVMSAASVKPRSGKLVTAVETDPDRVGEIVKSMKKTAPARAKLFAYIASEGSALLSELSRRFGGASKMVGRLAEDGLVEIGEARVWRDPTMGEVKEAENEPHEPTEHQAAALDKISTALDEKCFAAFLLHGVTGSGKTEVYLRAIARVIEQGRQALVLVPEIALTPQLLGRFRARFGSDVAVLHSGLGRGERLDEWTRVRRGMVNVAVGARSAVFAPFDNLGMIVVDEEHDGGYKQEDKVRYNARDFAVVRAKGADAVVVLGSATPSLESRKNAADGRYGLLELPERVLNRPMPRVELVDMRTAGEGRSEFFSKEMEEAIDENLKAGKQTLIFLNRRGFAPFLMCVECGHTFGCPNCSTKVTYHRRGRMLKCHLCDWGMRAPNDCPGCGGGIIKPFGAGTERIEDEISRIFPEARTARMDRDTVGGKGEIDRILSSLRKGDIDILVGTQMIAKGHDYPGVTLVGVVLAETSLNFPDFRAAETTFSLLAQVSGRAGRGRDPGRVVVQTYNPDHYAIRGAVDHDYKGFSAQEDKLRKDLGYPPYRRLAVLKFSGKNEGSVRRAAQIAAKLARRVKNVTVLGPSPSPWSKVKGLYRWQLLIKGHSPGRTRETAQYAYNGIDGEFKDVKTVVDIDPLNML